VQRGGSIDPDESKGAIGFGERKLLAFDLSVCAVANAVHFIAGVVARRLELKTRKSVHGIA
jgi:hypothetical protein